MNHLKSKIQNSNFNLAKLLIVIDKRLFYLLHLFDDEAHSINHYWLTTPLHRAIASRASFYVVCYEKHDMSA